MDILGNPWREEDFRASDDRVRGGASESYLTPIDGGQARFYGTLDTTALGGAGFASQRTATESKVWNLSMYDGIEIHTTYGDGRKYTIMARNELPSKRPDNRDRSTVVYEADFVVDDSKTKDCIVILWSEFAPTYRGKECNHAPKLDLKNIRRWNIMVRR